MSNTEDTDTNLPDLEYIRELAKVFQRYELDEIEIESGDQRILLRRSDTPAAVVAAQAPVVVPAPVAAAPIAAAAVTTEPESPKPEPEAKPGLYITSPFVGTFYRSPRPDAAAFVDVGKHVKVGDIVCVVEAMKLFNEIESELDCIIEEVLVDNASAVEFGTKLFRVRKP